MQRITFLTELTYKLHFYVFFNTFRTLSSSISICAGLCPPPISKFCCAGDYCFNWFSHFPFSFFSYSYQGKVIDFCCPLALVCLHLYLLVKSLENFLSRLYQYRILKTPLEGLFYIFRFLFFFVKVTN